MKLLLVALLATALVASVSAADGDAVLIVQKTLTSEHNLIARSKPVNVSIDVFNVGAGPAYDVALLDDWPNDKFPVTVGLKSAKWNEIAAGGRVQHNFTVEPRIDGEWQGFAAQISYHASVDAKEMQVGSSTPMRNVTVLSTDLFEKLTAKHIREWTVFWSVSSSLVLLPLFAYLWIQITHQHGIPKAATKRE